MKAQLKAYADRFNALTTRERIIVVVVVNAVLVFLWWSYFAQPLLTQTRALDGQALSLEREIQNLQSSMDMINRRISEGVHKSQMQQLVLHQRELERVNGLLKEKTLDLIAPDEMFALMRDMLFADSKLKLTGLKRTQVKSVFNDPEEEQEQPKIYRHVMELAFEGAYQDILSYTDRLEQGEWRLLWDSIQLKTVEYPVIAVSFEISTLSDRPEWVGL